MKDYSLTIEERNRRWQEPFSQMVAAGEIPGFSFANVTGDMVISTADAPREVWEIAERYPHLDFNTVTPFNTVSSTSATDTGIVGIIGLEHGTGELKTVFVQLNGQNQVTTDIFGQPFPMWATNAMFMANSNLTTGKGATNLGDVYLYQNGTATAGVPDDLSTVSRIINGPSGDFSAEGQDHSAIYYVPKGFTAYVWSVGFGLSRTVTATIQMSVNVRLFGGPEYNGGNRALTSTGTGIVEFNRFASFELPELSYIKFVCQSVSTVNVGVSGDMLLLLRDNQSVNDDGSHP